MTLDVIVRAVPRVPCSGVGGAISPQFGAPVSSGALITAIPNTSPFVDPSKKTKVISLSLASTRSQMVQSIHALIDSHDTRRVDGWAATAGCQNWVRLSVHPSKDAGLILRRWWCSTGQTSALLQAASTGGSLRPVSTLAVLPVDRCCYLIPRAYVN